MTEDSDADLAAEFGFEPTASATGRDEPKRVVHSVDQAADDVDATGTDGADASDTSGAAAADTDSTDSTADTDGHVVKARRRRRPGLRRRLGATAVLIGALSALGGGYATFAASSGAADSANSAASINTGRQLFQVSCITCHGANLQGVLNRGPSLIGVGGAAVYFQVSTGRMPAQGQGAQIQRKTAKFNDEQTRAIAAYVQSIGGGTPIPLGKVIGSDGSIAQGGELFRLNCASCHGTTGKGAPLSAGKQAPSLNAATNLQIVTAMLTGPENMPVFSDNQLTPDQKKAIVAYIQTLKASSDPGGSGIGRIGPVSEGIVIWVAGIGMLMVAILWIGAKAQ